MHDILFINMNISMNIDNPHIRTVISHIHMHTHMKTL